METNNSISSPVQPISDGTAQKLSAAMQQMGKAAIEAHEATKKASEAMKALSERAFQKRMSELTLKALLCEYEYLKASFFTRWYWKRKYKKAQAELEMYQSKNKSSNENEN